MKKIPMRKCLVTQEHFPKKELVRVVKTPEGEIVVDPTGKKNGRGAYLKINHDVFLLARKKKVLERALEAQIPESVYQELENLIK